MLACTVTVNGMTNVNDNYYSMCTHDNGLLIVFSTTWFEEAVTSFERYEFN